MNHELLPEIGQASGDRANGSQRPAISMTGVTKSFGKKRAVSGLDLSVPEGAVYALLGRNAAGKSTVMQLLLGLLEPSGGNISVLGHDPIKNGIELRTKLGYIPERLPLYEWMTVAETLRFVEGQYRQWSKSIEQDLITKFRLPVAQKVSTLSRGQRALLTLVLAMSHQPELVLLDECTSGMDAIAREEFDRSVIDLLHGSGRTVLFASHQINELERLCDWVGIMFDGRMLLQAKVDDLKSQVRALQFNGVDFNVPGFTVLRTQQIGRDQLLTVKADASLYDSLPNSVVDVIDLRLEQIFIALIGGEETQS